MRRRPQVGVAAHLDLEIAIAGPRASRSSQIKTESGCCEVYATGKDGKRVNIAYNAQTLEKLDNAEAGEN